MYWLPTYCSQTTFYKLLNETDTHNGVKHTTGLYNNPDPFCCKKNCSAGGLYFTDKEHVPKWASFGDYIYARQVTFPDDARIFVEPDFKTKGDKYMHCKL